ncbi:hypothetical protein [Oscillatoria sp. FACHB-1406]|uniref:hypothetical protein n=1 Tax=Oscillatoria sp. FACHB-1406 TaxID=2692846 RepID=UPI0016856476|nr:hypothetical protein [Oscillatoria sp. FACHB-1406]MBD2576538.1 hypothetical protein [Oscillatoria sp. FACHB-1406]
MTFSSLLVSCSDRKLSTTLAIDISESNVANTENHKLMEDMCKVVTLQLRSSDALTIARFNSSPEPSLLNKTITQSNSQQWRDHGKSICKTLFQYNISKNFAPPGTDIRRTWLSFYKNYEKQKIMFLPQKKDMPVEVFIALIDSLEPVSQNGQEKYNIEKFKDSVQTFINDGNFVFIYVFNHSDRQDLATDLDFVDNTSKRLIFLDENYQAQIDDIYSQARAEKRNGQDKKS